MITSYFGHDKCFCYKGWTNLGYLKGISRNDDASKAPIVSSVEDIVASLLSVVVFNERSILGIILMFGSIYLMNMKPEKSMEGELYEEVY